MTKQEILEKCRQFGADGDSEGFGYFAADHAFVVRDPQAKRNIGKCSAAEMLQAYVEGARSTKGC